MFRFTSIGVYTFQFSSTQNQEMTGFFCNIQPIPWYYYYYDYGVN